MLLAFESERIGRALLLPFAGRLLTPSRPSLYRHRVRLLLRARPSITIEHARDSKSKALSVAIKSFEV